MNSKIVYVCVSLLTTTIILFVTYIPARGYFEDYGFSETPGSWNDTSLVELNLQNATSWETGDFGESNGTHMMENLYDVQNDTLGFQEVNMISLPGRTDRQDSFALQASLSGISYKLVNGVDGSKVPSKALPFKMENNVKTNEVGCWRAHMNVLQSIVTRRITSALIFEDDADWDVALKMQLVQFARGSRFLLNTPDDTIPSSPYGDSWDLLWMGHCATKTDPLDTRRFVIPKDPTVLPPVFREEFEKPDMAPFEWGPDGDVSTRIVHIATWGSCTTAYAVSMRGAEKILYHMGILPNIHPIDLGLGFMCMDKTSNFTCIAPFPTLMGISKPAGPTNRWSDLDHVPGDDHVEEASHSERVMFSTRQNIGRLIRGEKVFKSQYPGATDPEMSIDQIGSAVGHPEWLVYGQDDMELETEKSG